MAAKKTISAREFHERMKALRKSPVRPEFVETFNKIVEEDEKREREEKKKDSGKKIARPPRKAVVREWRPSGYEHLGVSHL